MSRFQSLQALFFKAVELDDVAERQRFVDEACAGDEALRQELEELLACDAAGRDRGETLADRLVPVSASLESEQTAAHAGEQLGGYRLIREIGKGGMGAVFLAERIGETFQHRVAIKVIRGFPTREVLERFRRERAMLASLRHPNIARFFDGGTTAEGQPYLVMEHIEGELLNQWLLSKQPSIPERLRLFQSLCSAVQHAHRQLIIHRDIKPANVLVREDGDPVLLDFGIGKLLADESGDPADGTQLYPLTPAYASPEQLQGQAATTQSDVFGLGLVLFELLSGQPLRQANGRITHLSVSRAAAAGSDWTRRDARVLRGDLDNIVRKCLREEPERRYASVEALASDIKAWFDHRPVQAAPDAWHYRLRKLLMRHPLAFGATAATVVLLSALSMRLVIERDNALQAQAQSRLDAEAANQSASFMVELLKQASPDRSMGQEITVRTLMSTARQLLDAQRFSRPAIKSRLERALGEIYMALGQVPESEAVLESAVRRLDSPPGGAQSDMDRLELAQGLRQRCRVKVKIGRFEEARQDCTRAANDLTAVVSPDDPELAEAWMTLAVAEVSLGLYAEADAHLQAADALFAQRGEEQAGMRARVLHNQGWLRQRQGLYEESARLLEQALQAKRAVFGEVHPDVVTTEQALATTEIELGRLDSAITRLQRAVAHEVVFSGEPSDDVATMRNELALALMDAGRFGESAQQFQIALAQREAMTPDGSMETAHLLNNHAWLLEAQEDFPAAETRYRQSVAMRQALGLPERSVIRAKGNLARALLRQGQADAAEPLVLEAHATLDQLPVAAWRERVGLVLLRAELALARREMTQVAHWLDEVAGSTPPDGFFSPRYWAIRADLAHDQGDRTGEAERVRAQLDALTRTTPLTHPAVAVALLRHMAVTRRCTVDGVDMTPAQARSLIDASLVAAAPSRRWLTEPIAPGC